VEDGAVGLRGGLADIGLGHDEDDRNLSAGESSRDGVANDAAADQNDRVGEHLSLAL